jgi:UDP:flavonoid glycosyltransferase YjiC (YdhE family)
MGSQTRHVGGKAPEHRDMLPELESLPSADSMPWVLITLGTSFNRDPNFFLATSWAADRLGCLPLVAHGASKSAPWVQQMLPRLPHTAIVHTRFDFPALLPSVAAAFHHGGAGTTHALVVHAVPQIVVPHAADQMRQAHGIMRTGIGYAIQPQKATIENLEEALAAALPDLSPVRGKAQLLQNEFASLGGVSAAADILENLDEQQTQAYSHSH